MIHIAQGELLELVLAVESAAMLVVAGVFLLLLHSTRRGRGIWWLAGWTLFALCLAVEAAAGRFPEQSGVLLYLADGLCAASAFGAMAGAFEFLATTRIPAWAWGLGAASLAASLAVTAQTHFTARLMAPEVSLLAAMVVVAIIAFPRVRDRALAGVRTILLSSVLLGVMMLRTLVSGLVLSSHHSELNVTYWVTELLVGGILGVTLAMGELMAMLDEIRLDLLKSNEALRDALDGLEVAAKIDPLTGLYNRYAFYSLLNEFRTRAQEEVVLVILDLNRLKSINDSYGHYAGDRALLSIAERLRDLLGEHDYAFRWGGDEFVAVLFSVSPEQARERIRAIAPAAPLDIPELAQPLELTVSWGVSAFDPRDSETALREADRELYARKRVLLEAAQTK